MRRATLLSAFSGADRWHALPRKVRATGHQLCARGRAVALHGLTLNLISLAAAAVLIVGVWRVHVQRTATTTSDAPAPAGSPPPTPVSDGAAADDPGSVLYLVSSAESAEFLAGWAAQLGGELAVVVIETEAAAAPPRHDFGAANTTQGTGRLAVQVVDLRSATP